MDLNSAYVLRARTDEAVTQCISAQGVVADLTGVEFMESVTLGVLVEQRDDLRSLGKELALVIQFSGDPGEHPAGRLLSLSGQKAEFKVYDDRLAAIREMAN